VAITQAARLSKPSNESPVLRALGIPPEPGSLLDVALTHRSFAFEQPQPVPHNERLEFLGDAVIGLIVTDVVYGLNPDLAEGELARLRAAVVNTAALAAIARDTGLGTQLRLGRGELASGGREKASLLADAFEALVGAAYLELGLDYVTKVIRPLFVDALEEVVATGESLDSKGALQERVVHEHADRPSYRVASSGPDHDKRFVAHVYIQEELYGVGTGRSKKEAEQSAARQALARLEAAGAERSPAADEVDVGRAVAGWSDA
jgi:ribonuclease-3